MDILGGSSAACFVGALLVLGFIFLSSCSNPAIINCCSIILFVSLSVRISDFMRD